jgi:hypothetical protein
MKPSPVISLAFAILVGTAGAALAQAPASSDSSVLAVPDAAPPVPKLPPAATLVVPSASTTAANTTVPPEVPQAAPRAKTTGHHHGSVAMNGYLQRLHDQLKVTPAQAPLWNSFADVMRDGAADTGQSYRERRAKLANFNAVEDMNNFVALEQQRLDTLKQSATAFEALYAAMPPTQKLLADTVFRSELPGGPHAKRK